MIALLAAMLSFGAMLGSLGVLWIVVKLYTEIVKYRVLDPRQKPVE